MFINLSTSKFNLFEDKILYEKLYSCIFYMRSHVFSQAYRDFRYIRCMRITLVVDRSPSRRNGLFNFAVKIQKRYQNLGHKVVMVTIERDRFGLGISLAGHKDRNRMAVFICGLNPKGAASKQGGLLIGDEILEVGTLLSSPLLFTTCHLRLRTIPLHLNHLVGLFNLRFARRLILFNLSVATLRVFLEKQQH